MKTTNKLLLASAMAAASAGVNAELKALDDSALGELTGQAGITIDVETKYQIGEFAYHDAGSLLLTGIRFGGNRNEDGSTENTDVSGMSLVDNFRMTIDIAGSGADDTRRINSFASAVAGSTVFYADNELAFAQSEVSNLSGLYANAGNADAAFTALFSGTDSTTGLAAPGAKSYDDGDLVIHFGFTDPWQKSAAGSYAAYAADPAANFANDTYANVEDFVLQSVDFTFEIDAIGIADSAYADNGNALGGISNIVVDAANKIGATTGQAFTQHGGYTSITGSDATVLISNLTIDGYFGTSDLHIENDGNGFDGSGVLATAGLVADAGNADSVINWGSFVKITDLDVYIDIAGLAIKDLQIHNERGDLHTVDSDTTTSFGFAHSIRQIYAVKDDVLNVSHAVAAGTLGTAQGIIDSYVDGLALNTEFVGDIDIKHLSFGDTNESIGEIYLTDIESTTNWTISAH